MDPLYAHLFLNHIPVIGGIGALLLLAWGLYRRSIDVTFTALAAYVIVGNGGIASFATGSFATGKIHDPITQLLIDQHRDASIAALVGLEAAAVVAACGLFVWRSTRRYPMFAAVSTLVLGLAASVLIIRAASLGGPIGHPSLRATTAVRR
ncbi:MAG: hypothetical protein ACTHQM_07850 [Thermoanaerobaculia bacterium]